MLHTLVILLVASAMIAPAASQAQDVLYDHPDPAPDDTLHLLRGDVMVSILPDDWVELRGSGSNQLLARGRLVEISNGEISILGTHSNIVPISAIGAIKHYGEVRRINYYYKKGVLYGMALGLPWWIVLNRNATLELLGPLLESVPAVFVPVFLIGGGIGLAVGVVRQLKTEKYLIGPDQWVILHD